MKIAVLIPCYNEAKSIAKVVTDYRAALPEAEIFVYDNNSTDNTDEIARAAGATVRYERRQGKGNVIRTMFREIDADAYLMIDGDDTYPAENARAMVDLVLEQKADMVVGDRLSSTYFTQNKRPFHNTGNRMVRGMVNRIFHGNISDLMTGYRAFSYQFVKSFPVLSKGFEIETEMSIHALDKNLSIISVPVEYRDRSADNPSKLNTYSDGLRVLRTVARLYKEYRPLSFFGLFTALFGLVGVGMARIKGAVNAHKKRRKVLKLAKGYFGAKSRQYRSADEQVARSLRYAFAGRKMRKRDFRRLWITRINAAARLNDMSYSVLMNGLKKNHIVINRKMLADIAVNDPEAFKKIVESAK